MKQNLAISYAMKKKAKRMAMGGDAMEEKSGYEAMPTPMEPSDSQEDVGMVDRIMAKRMSKGGMVANEDSGLSSQDLDKMADGQPNEMDDLALRDELESTYTGENSGDMLGDTQETEDRHDMVSRIMRSRAKKDRLPNPR